MGSVVSSPPETSIPWSGGQWHHIAVTKSSAEGVRFCLDGNLVGADSRPAAPRQLPPLSEQRERMAALAGAQRLCQEPGDGQFAIDDLRVYDTALTEGNHVGGGDAQ